MIYDIKKYKAMKRLNEIFNTTIFVEQFFVDPKIAEQQAKKFIDNLLERDKHQDA